MPVSKSQVKFAASTAANYAALATKDANTIYFTTDTHRMFIGDIEYTKGMGVLTHQPVDNVDAGDDGRLYAYNGNMYVCNVISGGYKWTRVANVNDAGGSVTSITVGDGLTTAAGDDNPITTVGTIKHAVPSGASTHADSLTNQTAAFGGTVNVESVATDAFGHVTGINTHTITMPTETALNVQNDTASEVTLGYDDTFTVINTVTKGDGSHEVVTTATTYKMPATPVDTTYTISSTSEGKIHVAPSVGESYDVDINGWGELAKKSDISAVFKFKGTVATEADLPTTKNTVGDVYFVTADNSEYVWAGAKGSEAWQKLGPVIDLSAYAQRADVIGRVKDAEGQIPKLNSDGELVATGFTLGVSVPADAKFTDTTYSDVVAGGASGLMSGADKSKLDQLKVSDQHTHENKDILDKLSVGSDGNLNFNDAMIVSAGDKLLHYNVTSVPVAVGTVITPDEILDKVPGTSNVYPGFLSKNNSLGAPLVMSSIDYGSKVAVFYNIEGYKDVKVHGHLTQTNEWIGYAIVGGDSKNIAKTLVTSSAADYHYRNTDGASTLYVVYGKTDAEPTLTILSEGATRFLGGSITVDESVLAQDVQDKLNHTNRTVLDKLTETAQDGLLFGSNTVITSANIASQSVASATNAASATKATQDASGNVITTTYATKTELSDATSWTVF